MNVFSSLRVSQKILLLVAWLALGFAGLGVAYYWQVDQEAKVRQTAAHYSLFEKYLQQGRGHLQDFIANSCSIFAFCVSDSHGVSFYSDIPDLWLLWCDNSDLDLLDLCPGTIDLIALCIQNPASGCHIPGTFCQISERCLWLVG